MRAMGLRVQREDSQAGLLVTRQTPYDRDWPDASRLDLTATQTPHGVTLHVFVAPEFEPARLAVGAVLTTSTVFVPYRLELARGQSTIYGQAEFATYVAERIADRLGSRIEPLAAHPDDRARQAASRSSARSNRCGPAVLLEGDTPASWPRLVDEVKPQYPNTEIARHVGGTVQLRGEVTEHGTLTGLDWAGGIEDANLVAAATGAAGLWRFRAPVAEGCAARRLVVIEMSFALRR